MLANMKDFMQNVIACLSISDAITVLFFIRAPLKVECCFECKNVPFVCLIDFHVGLGLWGTKLRSTELNLLGAKFDFC